MTPTDSHSLPWVQGIDDDSHSQLPPPFKGGSVGVIEPGSVQ